MRWWLDFLWAAAILHANWMAVHGFADYSTLVATEQGHCRCDHGFALIFYLVLLLYGGILYQFTRLQFNDKQLTPPVAATGADQDRDGCWP